MVSIMAFPTHQELLSYLHGTAPAYLAESFNRAADNDLGTDCAPALHPHYWFRRLADILLVTVLSRSQACTCGTVCQPR